MTALRAFISRREREIREQISALRSELSELREAKKSLQPVEVATSADTAGSPTIKDMVKAILADRPHGLLAAEILAKIHRKFGVQIERTSLSPQLSRLRQEGHLHLEGGKWFPTQSFLAGWQDADELDEIDALIGTPSKAATSDD